jgi:hypothetical protein
MKPTNPTDETPKPTDETPKPTDETYEAHPSPPPFPRHGSSLLSASLHYLNE